MALPSSDPDLDAVLVPVLASATGPVAVHDLVDRAVDAGLELGPDGAARVRQLLDDLALDPAPTDAGFTGLDDGGAARRRRHVASVARRYGLEDDARRHLALLLTALALYRADPRGFDARPAGPTVDEAVTILDRALADEPVTEAFAYECITVDPAPAHALDGFAARLIDLGSTRAATPWLRARALDRLGRVEDVELLVQAALARDPGFVPALELAARYANDRGDAPRALELLRAAGVPDHDERVVLLQGILALPRPTAGRNDPCPCGSGRKFKQCCERSPVAPLDERARWLWHKGVEHLHDGPRRWRCIEVAAALEGVDTVTAESAYLALTSTLVLDLVLCEDHEWDRFLDQRGPLLPADERALAATWAAIGRSLFEVVEVRPGHGVVVRDLRSPAPSTGSSPRVEVRSPRFAAQAEPGLVVFSRVLPTGTTHQFFGGVHVLAPGQLERLTDLLDGRPDALAVAHAIGRAAESAPLTTSEGEPLVFCTARYRLGPDDAADGVAALVDRLTATGALTPADPDDDPGPPGGGLVPGLPSPFAGDGGLTDGAGPEAGGEPRPGSDAGDVETATEPAVVLVEHVDVHGQRWIRGTVTVTPTELVVRANADERLARLDELVHAVLPGAERVSDERRPAAELDAP